MSSTSVDISPIPTENASESSTLIIEGGRRLVGRVRVSGSKYSALAAIPALILAKDRCVLENVPDIADVRAYLRILRTLGASVEQPQPGVVVVDPRGVSNLPIPEELARSMRASYYLLPVLSAVFGQANVPFPGGDAIGPRPIDQHLKGFAGLGLNVTSERGAIKARVGRQGVRGAPIYLDVVSVGATINLILAAVLAEGTTVISNCDRGPYVVDVAELLNRMGAKIQGAGTSTIRVQGLGPGKRLGGCQHALTPDQSETATFMAMAVATRGDVVIEGVIPDHVESMTIKLREAGASVEEEGETLRVTAGERPRAIQVKTMPYPGFFTDYQPPLTALLTTAEGVSVVAETVWPGRLRYLDELRAMGASAQVAGQTAVLDGVPALSGARVTAGDLRAGAALIVAGLMAEGRTEIRGVEHTDRGYERIDEKLRGLGASMERFPA